MAGRCGCPAGGAYLLLIASCMVWASRAGAGARPMSDEHAAWLDEHAVWLDEHAAWPGVLPSEFGEAAGLQGRRQPLTASSRMHGKSLLAASVNSSSSSGGDSSSNKNCNHTGQAMGLRTFFIITGGSNWTRSDGWTNYSNLSFKNETQYSDYVRGGNVQTGICTRTYLFSTLVLPDHCCWFGITCCMAEQCVEEAMDLTLCGCPFGMVVKIQLRNNNLSGTLENEHTRDALDLINKHNEEQLQEDVLFDQDTMFGLLAFGFSCSLRSLQLQNNRIAGPLSARVYEFTKLRYLGLGGNEITGTMPLGVSNMSDLIVLDVSGNDIRGPVPADLCDNRDGNKNLMLNALLLNGNSLSGTLPNRCFNLFISNVADNEFTAVEPFRRGYSNYITIDMSNNHINNSFIAVPSKLLTELTLSKNRFHGSIPENLDEYEYLSRLQMSDNSLTGSIPASMFVSMSKLTYLALSSNQLNGTLPEIGAATLLRYLDLSHNIHLTGKLPKSLVALIMYQTNRTSTYLDITNTSMSCCGENFTGVGYGGYASYLPLHLEAVVLSTTQFFTVYDDSGSGTIKCPYLQRADHDDIEFPEWHIDPKYFMFEGCTCALAGQRFVNNFPEGPPVCLVDTKPGHMPWWIWLIVGLAIACLLGLLSWWALFLRGRRPVMVQYMLDARKRLKGPPLGGPVSIVVTDIEGFSDMMKRCPELMTSALLTHNNLIRKAKHANFGYTVEQEGDSYSVVFHEAADAVKFCLQVQQLLHKHAWPEGLFDGMESTGHSPQGGRMASRTSMFQAVAHNISLWSRTSVNRDGNTRSATKHGLQPRASLKLSRLSRKKTPPLEESSPAGSPDAAPSPELEPRKSQPPSLASPILGLRVRMGVATGVLPPGGEPSGSCVMEQAKWVSDAAAGGQVLLCSFTFKAVEHLAEELGCMEAEGFNPDKLTAMRPALWARFWRSQGRVRKIDEAVLLDMGKYMYCPHSGGRPEVLQLLSAKERPADPEDPADPADPADLMVGADGQRPSPDSAVAARAASVLRLAQSKGRPTAAAKPPAAHECKRLYQVLAPALVARGRYFGDKLTMKEAWVQVDSPYYLAPGTLSFPLGLLDQVPPGLEHPKVTMVFAMVEGGKQYASRTSKGAKLLHKEMLCVMFSALHQVPGGYLVRKQEGDLKYMLAFMRPEAALLWCTAVQESAMYAAWPESALLTWPEEVNDAGQLLFRGPRLKMGMCEGSPSSVTPDHMGRADYHGDSVNMAARYMDAAAHGGQLVCEAALATRVLAELQRMAEDRGGAAGYGLAGQCSYMTSPPQSSTVFSTAPSWTYSAQPRSAAATLPGPLSVPLSGQTSTPSLPSVPSVPSSQWGSLYSAGSLLSLEQQLFAGVSATQPSVRMSPFLPTLQEQDQYEGSQGSASEATATVAAAAMALSGAASLPAQAASKLGGATDPAALLNGTDQRSSAPTHERSSAPTHERSSAPRSVQWAPSSAQGLQEQLQYMTPNMGKGKRRRQRRPQVSDSGAAPGTANTSPEDSGPLPSMASLLVPRASAAAADQLVPALADEGPAARISPPHPAPPTSQGRTLQSTPPSSQGGPPQPAPPRLQGSPGTTLPRTSPALPAANGPPASVGLLLEGELRRAHGGAGCQASSSSAGGRASDSSAGGRASDNGAPLLQLTVATIVALRLGDFRFKGSPEAVPMAHLMPDYLAGRRFPREAPKGKGQRVTVVGGVLGEAPAPALHIIEAYRRRLMDSYLRGEAAAGPGSAAGKPPLEAAAPAGRRVQSVGAALFRRSMSPYVMRAPAGGPPSGSVQRGRRLMGLSHLLVRPKSLFSAGSQRRAALLAQLADGTFAIPGGSVISGNLKCGPCSTVTSQWDQRPPDKAISNDLSVVEVDTCQV